MALWKDEKKEEAVARELPRRPTARNTKKKPPNEDVPVIASASPPRRKSKKPPKPKTGGVSLLDQVNAMMGPPTSTDNTPKKGKKNTSARSSIRQEPDEPLPVKKSSKKTKQPEQKKTQLPPPSQPAKTPPPKRKSKATQAVEDSTIPEIGWFKMTLKDNNNHTKEEQDDKPAKANSPKVSAVGKQQQQPESTLNFLQSLEQVNTNRKQKKKKKKKLSASRKSDIEKEMAKRKKLKAKALEEIRVEDDTIEGIGWFTMTVKENCTAESDSDEEPTKTKKKKEKKQLRSTADYSREYPFTTRQAMEEKAPNYYLHMIGIKQRKFHIDNLFCTTRPVFPRVYHFDVDSVKEILDKKEDKWWIKSRLPLYQEEEEEEDEDDEMGMEVLVVFFGPNEIDHDPEQDDNSVIFSIASVESIHFSDDDENQETYKGKMREKVEVMPGEFKIIRKEEETYEAIETGNYMSSLCLGCGVALVSVQDAREVACPTCGSITPLNGVCLYKPFGIATGIKRVKVEHLLAPRKSIFLASSASVPPSVITTNTTDPDRQAEKEQRKCKNGAAGRKEGSKATSSNRPGTTKKSAKAKSRPGKPATKPGAVQVIGR